MTIHDGLHHAYMCLCKLHLLAVPPVLWTLQGLAGAAGSLVARSPAGQHTCYSMLQPDDPSHLILHHHAYVPQCIHAVQLVNASATRRSGYGAHAGQPPRLQCSDCRLPVLTHWVVGCDCDVYAWHVVSNHCPSMQRLGKNQAVTCCLQT